MKCGQDECNEPAAYKFLWPGAQEYKCACADHAKRAREIAETMGVRLELHSIPVASEPEVEKNFIRFPEPKPEVQEPLFVGPFMENRVIVDSLELPLLTGFKDQEGYWLVVDRRFACGPFPTEEIARQAALCAGQAMAVTAGYPHMGAQTKDRPFAPIVREIT